MNQVTNHKKSLGDLAITAGLILFGGAVYTYEFVTRRVIKGDIHWNETLEEYYKRVGKTCNCRECKPLLRLVK
jgi:hypothetical protein